jgi:hypothetical protein
MLFERMRKRLSPGPASSNCAYCPPLDFGPSDLDPIAPISFRPVECAIGTNEGRAIVAIARFDGCYADANCQRDRVSFLNKGVPRHDLTQPLCGRPGGDRVSAGNDDSEFLSTQPPSRVDLANSISHLLSEVL